MSTKKPTSLSLNSENTPIPVPITVQHVDSKSSLEDHIDSDAHIMTTQIAILMQAWGKLTSLSEMCSLSDQLMKTLKTRRQLCLRPTSRGEIGDSDEVDITPV